MSETKWASSVAYYGVKSVYLLFTPADVVFACCRAFFNNIDVSLAFSIYY